MRCEDPRMELIREETMLVSDAGKEKNKIVLFFHFIQGKGLSTKMFVKTYFFAIELLPDVLHLVSLSLKVPFLLDCQVFLFRHIQ